MTTPIPHQPLTLSIDIGGTGIKMMVLDTQGNPLTEYLREPTPHPATVAAVTDLFQSMIAKLNTPFDRVSAGYPGVVIEGVVKTAAHLDPSWIDVNLQQLLEGLTDKPTHAANDADVQGFGDICGQGLELVITLGTGIGSALFIHGVLVPNLELGHHPFVDNLSYEGVLAKAAIKAHGEQQWVKYLQQAIALWQKIFNYDQLYLGGGYAQQINFSLPHNVTITENKQGVLGGIKLWDI